MTLAMGMIETKGFTASVEALDSMLKSADVKYIGRKKVGKGFNTVFIEGDIGAVKMAIDMGVRRAEQVGELRGWHVIPKPNESIRRVFDFIKNEKKEDKIDKPQKKETKKQVKETKKTKKNIEKSTEKDTKESDKKLLNKKTTIKTVKSKKDQVKENLSQKDKK